MIDEFAVFDDGDLAVHIEAELGAVACYIWLGVRVTGITVEGLRWRVKVFSTLSEADLAGHRG